MGKKRRGRPSKKQTKTITSDVLGGFLVVFGVILTIFISFKNMGSVANIFKIFFMGLLGKFAYSIPVLLILIGIYCIVSDKKVSPLSELRKGLIIISLIAGTLTVFTTQDIGLFTNPVKVVADSVKAGIESQNMGGAVGTIIGGLVSGIIGTVASRIVLPIATFVISLFVLNISFKQFFGSISYAFSFVADHISSMFDTLFRDDDVKKYEYDEEAIARRERIKEQKLAQKGSKNVDENLDTKSKDQVEFDFDKLEGKTKAMSQEELDGKRKRDEYFTEKKEQKEDKSIKEVLTLEHTTLANEDDSYVFPPINLLTPGKSKGTLDKRAISMVAKKLQNTLASFGVEATVHNITKGPTVTRYELTPSVGVKVSKIVNLTDDIALNLAAKSIRIEAPIPGKSAVGIEIPNDEPESVMLREVIDSDTFKNHKSKICFALGKDVAGEVCVGDIAKMPHMLIAGTTGSGKSVCINSIIVSILYKSKPSEVKMILIDPKMVELSVYNGIPHLLIPVVTDSKKAAGALNWAVQEMENRYKLFAQSGVKDLKGYNELMEKQAEGTKLPQMVIIIDELADLMMVAPNDVETAICRIAQKARACGMHLIVATQRPSVDVITGLIKANVPSRIAFTVSNQVDSRTILDSSGAEKLLGKGDMLYFPVGENKPLRIQGTFVSEKEIEDIVENIKENSNAVYSEEIIKSIETVNSPDNKNKDMPESNNEDDTDELLEEAIDLVMDMGQASASMLQRKFKIGYSRAGRIVDQMEARGLISGYDGSKPRQLLITKDEWQELKMGGKLPEENTSNQEDNGANENDDGFVSNNDNQKKSNIDIEL